MARFPSCLSLIILDFAALPAEIVSLLIRCLELDRIPISTLLIQGTLSRVRGGQCPVLVSVPAYLSEEEIERYAPPTGHLPAIDWYRVTFAAVYLRENGTEETHLCYTDHGPFGFAVRDFILIRGPFPLTSIPLSPSLKSIRVYKRGNNEVRYDLSKLTTKELTLKIRDAGGVDLILPRGLEEISAKSTIPGDPPEESIPSLRITFPERMVEFITENIYEGTVDIRLENKRTRMWSRTVRKPRW